MFGTSIFAFISALFTGIISGYGVGGGTILIIILIFISNTEQRTAQGINLAYFLPTAIGSLFFHIKNKLVDWSVFIPASITGVIFAAITSYLIQDMDVSLLKRIFGVMLLYVGIRELFAKS